MHMTISVCYLEDVISLCYCVTCLTLITSLYDKKSSKFTQQANPMMVNEKLVYCIEDEIRHLSS